MFLISDAMAATTATQGAGGFLGGGGLKSLGLPVILLIVFYFLLIRPQQKRAKAQKLLLNQIERGDKVVTNSGIIGIIAKPVNPEDTDVSLEIAPNLVILIKRAAISGVDKSQAHAPVAQPKEKKSKKERREEAKAESAKAKEESTQPVYESESSSESETSAETQEENSSTDTDKEDNK